MNSSKVPKPSKQEKRQINRYKHNRMLFGKQLVPQKNKLYINFAKREVNKRRKPRIFGFFLVEAYN
ncbi:MAG: hypothetical protein WCJ39_10950, partial [bacterium]